MDKGIGFNRNIFLKWLDAAAEVSAQHISPADARQALVRVVGQDITSSENRRKAIDILLNIWAKSSVAAPALHQFAVQHVQSLNTESDRIWLHYGLTVVYYPFVREAAAAVGHLSKYQEAITPAMVKQRLMAERGQLGSLEKAVERILFSFRDWGVLRATDQRYAYAAKRQVLCTDDMDLQCWLLACALRAHPAEELPFSDLVRLPELFPFRISTGIDDIRQRPWFAIQRQGVGWDMVRHAIK